MLINAGLNYNGYRLKRRSNIELQQKEGWINQQNVDLEQLLADKCKLLNNKEVLVKEIQHRVKNNLICSLLEYQSAFLDNEALIAVHKSQHRIKAISLIHQKLYVTENVTNESMPVYIREIVTYLQDSFKEDEHIVFNLFLDAIEWDILQVVPLGLIVTKVLKIQ